MWHSGAGAECLGEGLVKLTGRLDVCKVDLSLEAHLTLLDASPRILKVSLSLATIPVHTENVNLGHTHTVSKGVSRLVNFTMGTYREAACRDIRPCRYKRRCKSCRFRAG